MSGIVFGLKKTPKNRQKSPKISGASQAPYPCIWHRFGPSWLSFMLLRRTQTGLFDESAEKNHFITQKSKTRRARRVRTRTPLHSWSAIPLDHRSILRLADMRGVTFRRDNPVRTRICLLTPLSGFCPDLYLGERPILGRSCPDLYLKYNRIVRGPLCMRRGEYILTERR